MLEKFASFPSLRRLPAGARRKVWNQFDEVGSGAFAGLSSGLLYTFLGYGGVNTGNAAFGVLLILGTAATYMVIRKAARNEPALQV